MQPHQDAAIRVVAGLQVSSQGYSYLFDLVEASEELRQDMVRGLGSLLQSDAVEVIMHDGRQDAAALLYQYKIFIANVFDTQASTTS